MSGLKGRFREPRQGPGFEQVQSATPGYAMPNHPTALKGQFAIIFRVVFRVPPLPSDRYCSSRAIG